MSRQIELQKLHQAVIDLAERFETIDENLRDGKQSTREILSHIVFWHREYVAVMNAIAQEQKPKLRTGKYYQLNALAYRE